MYFAVYVVDKPGTADIRKTVVAAHRKYVQDRVDKILAAGATFADDGTTVTGGSFILDADREWVQKFVDEDPFTTAGIRDHIIISPWIKAVFDRQFNIPTDDRPLAAGSVE